MSKRDKIVGILGGMGPESTAELFLRIIKATPVKREQEHLRIIIDNNPGIPDRTRAILNKGQSPLEEMVSTALNLERAGAELIAIPCNTAHYWLDDLRQRVSVPVIDMISETSDYVSTRFSVIKKVGLLATSGTVEAELYQGRLKPRVVLLPDSESQAALMDVIYGEGGIKLGFTEGVAQERALSIAQALVGGGTQALILGCTEISLVLAGEDIGVPLIDPLQVLAEAVVREARHTGKI
ncbi:MAG: amino acid racemase [Dehalococcoidales bacterium]|nr:amino acid racemase [Dehalococcoidales bacterium]